MLNQFLEYTQKTKSPNTYRSYKKALEIFGEYCNANNKDVNNFSLKDAYHFQSVLSDTLSHSSVNSYCRYLSSCFQFLLENNFVSENPFSQIKPLKEAKKIFKVLSEEEIEKILEVNKKNKEDILIFSLLTFAGLRRDELVNIKISDIEGNKIKIRGKGNKERYVFMNKSTYEKFLDYIKIRKPVSEYLFFSPQRGKYTTEAIRLKVKSLCKNAGVDNSKITPHTLRRTFATRLLTAEVNINVIQKAMGHSNINTTMRYAQIRDELLANAFEV
ncbi:MAG: tyrosine recombinase XerC [Candidatus Woesearchaeota archaeon]|nr:MAG: tyrosine recombinase XerC [Candidatus Woesearchaeota archaeon]